METEQLADENVGLERPENAAMQVMRKRAALAAT